MNKKTIFTIIFALIFTLSIVSLIIGIAFKIFTYKEKIFFEESINEYRKPLIDTRYKQINKKNIYVEE